MLKRIIAAVVFCLAISAFACADTIWMNGIPATDSRWCNDCFGEGWVPYDNFQVSSPATIAGFSLVSDVIYGAAYNNTNWYLWGAQPVTAAIITSPIASGVATATPDCGGTPPAATGDMCTQAFSITALNLAPGTYWVGFANQFSNKSYSSIFNSSGSPLPGGDGQINLLTNESNPDYFSKGDFAFTVEGSVQSVPPAVPEPATTTLLCSGLIAMAGVIRNKMRK